MLRFPTLKPVGPEPLAVFRIALGLLMLIELLLIAPVFVDLYGPKGFLQANLMSALTYVPFEPIPWLSRFLGTGDTPALWIVFTFQCLSLICLIAGIYTRAASIGAWLGQTVLMNTGLLSVYGLDRYFHLFLFIGLFLPWGDAFSWDARRKNIPESTSSAYARFLLFLQLAFVMTYLNAGVSKMHGQDWWTGDAIWRAVNVPDFRQFNMLWLAKIPLVVKFFSRGTLLLETGFILAIWNRHLRTPWVLAIIGLHLGIAVFMGLYLFAISMIVFNAVLFLYPTAARNFRDAAGLADLSPA